MTTAGVITMLLSISAVWTLLILCCIRLLRHSSTTSKKKN